MTIVRHPGDVFADESLHVGERLGHDLAAQVVVRHVQDLYFGQVP